MRPFRPQRRDVALALAAGHGGVLLVIAYLGAAGAEDLDDQVVWLTVATLGVTMAGAAEILWLTAARHRVSVARDHVADLFERRLDRSRAGRHDDAGRRAPEDRALVVVGSWSHSPHCLLAAGKHGRRPGPREAIAPCPVCGADG